MNFKMITFWGLLTAGLRYPILILLYAAITHLVYQLSTSGNTEDISLSVLNLESQTDAVPIESSELNLSKCNKK